MNYVVNGYEPKAVFEIFEDICAIPHGSGNEKGVADYIETYASKRGLFVLRDETGNVFVRKKCHIRLRKYPRNTSAGAYGHGLREKFRLGSRFSP